MNKYHHMQYSAHTWGSGEPSLQDPGNPESKSRSGYAKIVGCCELARLQGWEYVWIDTCCIDKTSSAELPEAINSMLRCYQDAEVCYTYVSDVSITTLDRHAMELFSGSRWFTRGWTLQELLAPKTVVFYDREWREVGTRQTLRNDISTVTGIMQEQISNPMKASAAQKMSWASKRRTTRLEDISYCLMVLFDVNMPLLHGNGTWVQFLHLSYHYWFRTIGLWIQHRTNLST